MRIIDHCFRTLVIPLLVVISSVLISQAAVAGETTKTAGSTSGAGNAKAVVYKPPTRGAPATRVGGGSRGPEGVASSLYVLAPEHTGLTTRAQPMLYWFSSRPVNARFEFALVNDNDMRTIIEKELGAATRAGIHSVSLKELGVTLKPGVSYQWSVAVVADREQRSKDLFASGTIERLSTGKAPDLRQPVSTDEAVFRYAEDGIWYDAIAAVSGRIRNSPREHRAVEQRAALLDQVGLGQVAAFERERVR